MPNLWVLSWKALWKKCKQDRSLAQSARRASEYLWRKNARRKLKRYGFQIGIDNGFQTRLPRRQPTNTQSNIRCRNLGVRAIGQATWWATYKRAALWLWVWKPTDICQKIIARVPLLELYKYSSTLRSLSQTEGKTFQRFSEFAPVPSDIQKKLIDDYKAHADEDHHH